MPNNGKNILYDGFRSLEQGIDNGFPPHLLPENQCAIAINTTFRGGSATCRPGFVKRVLTFGAQTLPDNSTLTGAAKKSAFEGGLFQGAGYFNPANGSPQLVASVSGHIYTIDLMKFNVRDITPFNGAGENATIDRNSARERMAWMLAAKQFFMIQNKLQPALIYTGSEIRRANSKAGEIPTGGPMAFYMGRLWVANGRNYWASDLAGGSSGTEKYDLQDAILKFTENEFLAGGGSFTAEMEGDIVAMQPVLNLNTALGHQDMAVFSPDGVIVVSVPLDRRQWQDMDTPLQRFAQLEQGALCAVTPCNGDIWYRSQDGYRSMIIAVRNFSDWGSTPLSGELGDIPRSDSEHLLGYGGSVVFDNRLLHTMAPFQTPRGVAHRGLVVLDFDLISRMRTRLPPAWEGIWTGLQVLKVIKTQIGTQQRCFAFVVSSDNRIELWELTRNGTSDNGEEITWSLDLRRMVFGFPELFKQLSGGTVSADKIKGRVYFTAQYRSDRNPNYQTWHNWSECANSCLSAVTCNPDTGLPEINMPQPQARPNMRLPEPPETCDTVLGRPFSMGYEFQARLIIQGHCVISKMKLKAKSLGEEILPEEPCLGDADCKDLTACQTDKYQVITGVDDGIIPVES